MAKRKNSITTMQRLAQMKIYLADLKANKGKRNSLQPDWLKQILSSKQ